MVELGCCSSAFLGYKERQLPLGFLTRNVPEIRSGSCSLRVSANAGAQSAAAAGRKKAKSKPDSANVSSDAKPRQGRLSKTDEIYNMDDGWKVPVDPKEKGARVANIVIPSSASLPSDDVRTPIACDPRKVHKILQIRGGERLNKKLLSPDDRSVRPMMEVVRSAVFNMLSAREGAGGLLYSGRWLDLYCGTGAVGLEALSRGCTEAHFVELDPWVVTNVLEPNINACKYMEKSVIIKTRVETYLERQAIHPKRPEPFEYISVCPPYEAVNYPTLMEQLDKSPLVGPETYVIVEYPLKSKDEIPETCGSLIRIVDRRYGRTYVAVYGPEWKKSCLR